MGFFFALPVPAEIFSDMQSCAKKYYPDLIPNKSINAHITLAHLGEDIRLWMPFLPRFANIISNTLICCNANFTSLYNFNEFLCFSLSDVSQFKCHEYLGVLRDCVPDDLKIHLNKFLMAGYEFHCTVGKIGKMDNEPKKNIQALDIGNIIIESINLYYKDPDEIDGDYWLIKPYPLAISN